MEITRREVPATAASLAQAGLTPLLARLYAARGVQAPAEIDHALTRLPELS